VRFRLDGEMHGHVWLSVAQHEHEPKKRGPAVFC